MDKDKLHLRINRQYPRIDTDIPCTVGLVGGQCAAARILNLSIGGLKFCCGRDTLERILPKDQNPPVLATGSRIGMAFDLPAGGRPATPIKLTARVVHYERLAQDLFHFGVQFLDIDAAACQAMEACIEAG